MVPARPTSRNVFFKGSLIALGALIILFFGVHTWIVHNARTILKDYISTESKGKIKLELSGLRINLLIRRLQIHEADLLSTDSLNEPITYHVTFSKLSLRVHSLWQLLLNKKLSLDSLKLYDPVIEVMQWRKDSTQIVKDQLSIAREMGREYNSLINTLNDFGVRRIIIDNAAFSLINKMKPGSEPVTVSNIYLNLVRTPEKKGNDIVYLSEKQALQVKSSNQDISLPDGRHRLSFRSLNLQLFRRSMELDSCTITAMATDSLKSSYSIFFKKLLLSGVDFNALSAKNLIKADTVLCENPIFNLSLYRSDAVEKKTK